MSSVRFDIEHFKHPEKLIEQLNILADEYGIPKTVVKLQNRVAAVERNQGGGGTTIITPPAATGGRKGYKFTVVAGLNTVTIPVTLSSAAWMMVASYMLVGASLDYTPYTGKEFNKTTTSFDIYVSDAGELQYFLTDDIGWTYPVIIGWNTIPLPIVMQSTDWVAVADYMIVGAGNDFVPYLGKEKNKTTTSFDVYVSDNGVLNFFVVDKG